MITSTRITDPELERRYLGGAMIDPRILDEHPLPVSCFGVPAHREVAAAMAAIVARGERVTEERLDRELVDLGHHATAAKRPFGMAVVCPDDPAALCERLRDLSMRRELATGTEEALRQLQAGEALTAVQAHLGRLADLEVGSDDRTVAIPLASAAEAAHEEAERASAGAARVTVTTGMPPLDDLCDGWDRGDLIVLAGDSGAGKSSTMLAMGRAQAAAGERVLIVTLEDHRARWGRRALNGAANIPIRALKSGSLTRDQWIAAADGLDRIRSESVWLASPLGGYLHEVLATIRRARAQHGITVAYVDYLQAIAQELDAGDQALRHHIRDCLEAGRRETARGAQPLTLIFGSQYRKREDESKRPRNADLYEASYIHQKADAILHLWKDNEGARFWWLGKHKDEDPREGKLVRDPKTGFLSGGATKPQGAPAQAAFDDPEWWNQEAR